MVIVLRFVDKEGFIRKQFLDLVHVKDTTSLALEKAIYEVILRYCLNMDNIHEKLHIKIQLEHSQLYVDQRAELQKASTIVELCQNCLSCTNSYRVYCNNRMSIFSHKNCEDKASQHNGG
ncbi:hypothetical protein J1N35_002232 [Gossypium stocksii]|uniref:DUF4371 domain-containing protein n=1 Tax=Gossypium stocksii TaxID=47602 RepID=A0A9D3WKM3_9ROSI|nr:hypothetical protein J1N35_002232 [Gossypium stocksii]